MGEFRVVMEVTTDDFEGLVELLEEASASLEQRLQGVVAWETFGDEAAGMVLIQEVFANEDAADAYEEHMKDHGLGGCDHGRRACVGAGGSHRVIAVQGNL